MTRRGPILLGTLILLFAERVNSAEEIRGRYTIRLPVEQWAISLAIPGYKVEREETREAQAGIMVSGRRKSEVGKA